MLLTRLKIVSAIVLTLALPRTSSAAKMTYHGGKVLVHPDIILLFWGPAWTTSSAGQIAGAFQGMVGGPYFSVVNQYSGVQFPHLSWMSIDLTTPLPSTTFVPGDIANYVNGRLAAGAVPAIGGEQIYVVVMPPGYFEAGADGRHFSSTFSGQNYYLAWVPSDPNLAVGTSATSLLGHEISEAMTDPDGDAWCEDDNGHCTGPDPEHMSPQEIGDVCSYTVLSGIAYAQLWSEADQVCVVSRNYGSIWKYNNSPNNWTQVWGAVRQTSCGPWGLVATNTSDNAFKYNGSPNSWTQIDGPEASFVVGQDSVYAQTSDLSGIKRYSGTGTSWTTIGSTAVDIYAGGFGVFGTNIGGNNLYKWSGSGTSWSFYGNPASAFTVGSNFIAGVSPDHSGVWRTTNGTWSQVRTSATAQIFGGGLTSALIATDTGTGNVNAYSSGTTWLPQGGPGYMFGLSGGVLYGLTPTRGGIFNSTSLTTSNPSWTQDGNAATRLVTGCPSLYATNGIVQCDEGFPANSPGSCATLIGP